jgi:ATP-dependent DNA helicase RecG
MIIDRPKSYLISLIHELCSLPVESEWVEFKHNHASPQEVGEYISALSNSAMLLSKANAYLVWGIDDKTHDIIGTRFIPGSAKVGNEELENWLLRLLDPKINFRFFSFAVDEKPIVLLEISPAFRHPVKFKNEEFIRIGSYKKRLKGFPEKERALWRSLDQMPFESSIAEEHVERDDIFRLLDAPSYFELLELPLPDGRSAILESLREDNLIQQCEAGGWNVTNLGAILFARKLDDFPKLKRKAMRVILYKGKGRVETQREQTDGKGYATGFEGLISFIMALVPTNEIIEQALRKTAPMYPELAIRELVANALIHQDFFSTGTGPMVELFEDRVEITNPGMPLVSTERFLDTPPKSRNEALASLMRRFRICEERGSGIDKVVFQTEMFQLPAPLFEAPEEFTRTVLFSHRPLVEMDKEDRIRACYLHACLKYVQRNFLTNTSLRKRFGIKEKNRSMASRLIRDAVEGRAIVPYDPTAAPKLMKYVPWWAASEHGDGRL